MSCPGQASVYHKLVPAGTDLECSIGALEATHEAGKFIQALQQDPPGLGCTHQLHSAIPEGHGCRLKQLCLLGKAGKACRCQQVSHADLGHLDLSGWRLS